MKGVVFVLVIALALLVTVVSAADGGATVVDEFGCQIIAADWGGTVTLTTTDSHAVQTPSGNINFICHFEIPADQVVSAERQKGFTCGAYFDTTNRTWSVTSPDDGEVLLRCQVKK